jgi:curved DNA-binding protein
MSRGYASMSAREAQAVLGLAAAVDQQGVRRAYLSAVKAAHPDRPGGDAERLRQVIEAYDVLRLEAASAPAVPRPARPASRPLEITPAEAMVGGVRTVTVEGVGEVSARLPAGLRVGDMIAVSGVAMTISIGAGEGAAVVGDHVCLTITVDRAIVSAGGAIEAETPAGVRQITISRQDAARGLVRVIGGGLPARGRHPQGDLLIKLTAPPAEAFETRTRTLLRRFTATWAA